MKTCTAALGAAMGLLPSVATFAALAQPDHIVIVIEENHAREQIVGNSSAPYINNTLIANGLYFSNAHGTDHDSQPNYLELFSGANPGFQGINSPLKAIYPSSVNTATDSAAANRENNSDNYNANQPFSVPNLGAELLSKGFTFTGYSEGLPFAGDTEKQFPENDRQYVEKHNPWAQFQGSGTNQLPASTNQPLTSFPSDFTKLPTVSFVVPNELNDMHDTVSVAGLHAIGSTGVDSMGNPVNDSTTIQNGDNWLKAHIDAYRQWAMTHNSLLITTWDEDDFNIPGTNNIATIINGDPRLVQPGVNPAYVNHFNLLRTIEDQFGLGHAGLSAEVGDFSSNAQGALSVPLPNGLWAGGLGLVVGIVACRRLRRSIA